MNILHNSSLETFIEIIARFHTFIYIRVYSVILIRAYNIKIHILKNFFTKKKKYVSFM